MEVSISEPKVQERLNLKIKYKNQRLQQAKEVYLCQCQKNYLSFPALYLHVKNKHKIKLTTKITDKICKMQQRDGKTYITYFLRNQEEFQGRKQDQIQSEQAKKSSKNDGIKTNHGDQYDRVSFNNMGQNFNRKKSFENTNYQNIVYDLRTIAQQFLREANYSNLYFYQSSSKIIVLFIDYIQKCSQISKQFEYLKNYQQQRLIDSLPLYFNEFICCFLPWCLSSQKYQGIDKFSQIQTMKLFGKWLRQKNYTRFQIVEEI